MRTKAEVKSRPDLSSSLDYISSLADIPSLNTSAGEDSNDADDLGPPTIDKPEEIPKIDLHVGHDQSDPSVEESLDSDGSLHEEAPQLERSVCGDFRMEDDLSPLADDEDNDRVYDVHKESDVKDEKEGELVTGKLEQVSPVKLMSPVEQGFPVKHSSPSRQVKDTGVNIEQEEQSDMILVKDELLKESIEDEDSDKTPATDVVVIDKKERKVKSKSEKAKAKSEVKSESPKIGGCEKETDVIETIETHNEVKKDKDSESLKRDKKLKAGETNDTSDNVKKIEVEEPETRAEAEFQMEAGDNNDDTSGLLLLAAHSVRSTHDAMDVQFRNKPLDSLIEASMMLPDDSSVDGEKEEDWERDEPIEHNEREDMCILQHRLYPPSQRDNDISSQNSDDIDRDRDDDVTSSASQASQSPPRRLEGGDEQCDTPGKNCFCKFSLIIRIMV